MAADLWPWGAGNQYTLSSPTGAFTTNAGSSATYFDSDHFTDFASLKEAASGDWSLTYQDAQGISHYTLHPDLSSLSDNNFPELRILSPTPGQVVQNPRPTFQWDAPFGAVQLSVWGGSISTGTATTAHSYVPTSDLPSRTYTADITMTRNLVPLPIEATLLDGPGIGTFTSGMDSTSDAITTFTVAAPEPASAGVVLLCASALMRRTRRLRSL